jgi:hypothetical protein
VIWGNNCYTVTFKMLVINYMQKIECWVSSSQHLSWEFRSSAHETLLGEQFHTWKTVCSSWTAWPWGWRCHIPLKWVTTHPLTQCNIAEDLNSWMHASGNLRSHAAYLIRQLQCLYLQSNVENYALESSIDMKSQVFWSWCCFDWWIVVCDLGGCCVWFRV